MPGVLLEKDVTQMNRKTLAAAFPHTVPVLMGYLSIGVVFGWMLSAVGFAPTWAAIMSTVCPCWRSSGAWAGENCT